ncbi:endonuclease/exonuclease/phosphatase family protein [Chelativorans sp. YIM 93263]|uniref:endonuclease/exonuclease/phosphatase family protein n=1 Tax=Chelativorans sp. YIM 93263 TaxID=2906648 RepID=UPI002379C2AD|nr:endonuclease/exonuclease/phosphatase family protein [Chelativorans sp. YIM 93263]
MSDNRRLLPLLLALCVTLTTIPLVLGFLGGLHLAFDSFAHFRVHLALLVVVLALPLLLYSGWRRIGLMAIVLSLSSIASVTVPTSSEARANAATAQGEPARYRLLQLNLRYDNRSPREVLSLIGRVAPDVITLEEVSGMWRDELGLVESAYPYRIICDSPSPVGSVAILSRRPFLHPSTARCYNRGALAIATVKFGGTAIDIAALHLGWPWPFEQPWQIRHVEPPLTRLGGTAILGGDLNAVPWSAIARRVATAGGLTPIGDIGPTWLARPLPNALRRNVGLPIDNVFVKGGIVPLRTERLRQVGSDHLPVLLEFAVNPQGGEPGVMQATLGQ